MKIRIRKSLLGGLLSLLLALLFGLLAYTLRNDLVDQQAATRWSPQGGVSQISCYFSRNAGVTPETLKSFGYSLDGALKSESITVESENPDARLWVDSYSAEGKITLTNRKKSITVDAIGIGGDFFLFHPFTLKYGSYFSGDDLMQDYCVIDEVAAWQLFGSNDVVGQMITIGGIPHMVIGVIQQPEGRLYEAAGLDGSLVYVSYDTLSKYGQSQGINHYEILMPNPVNEYALTKVKEGLRVDEKEVEILENTSRFSFLNMCKLFTKVGTRSMNGKAIPYPFWENVARGYEDMVSMAVFCMLLCLVYPVGYVLIRIILWWKRRTWTWKDAGKWMIGRLAAFGSFLFDKCKSMKSGKKKKKKKSDVDTYFEEDEDYEKEMDE